MSVDVIGIGGVAQIIRQSNLPRFFITHYQAGKGSTPVFEVWDSSSSEVAIRKFNEWGNTLLSGNPANETKYEITLHSQDRNNLDEEEKAVDGNPKRARSNRMRFSFVLSTPRENGRMGVINGNGNENFYSQPPVDLSKYIPAAEFEKQVREKVESEKLKLEMAAMRKEMKEIREGGGKDEGDGEPAWIGTANKILDRFFPTPQPQQQLAQPAAVNGVFDELPDEQLDRIDDAVEKILKTDPNFIDHLEKLSKLAEKQPQYFMQLIAMLQNVQV